MFGDVKQFFDGLGWLANMLALAPVFAAAFGIYAKVFVR
jgi:hypothetical protein